MAKAAAGKVTAIPKGMTREEWQTRSELAACYRLTALYGWTDMIGTHISARVPGTETFLLNPFGMLFEEITASSLIKVDQDGNALDDSEYPVNPAAFTIHSAVHMSSDDMNCVMHTHTRAGNAVAMIKDGLLPLNQKALLITGFIAYHDYEGAALDLDERQRIVASLGGKRILILRNHGLLTVGKSIGEAFSWMYSIETACRYQVDALGQGRELNELGDETREHAIAQGLRIFGEDGFVPAGTEWPALIRQLERRDGTGYRS